MPVNKDALSRYRIIDEMLSDPMGSYTTEDILRRVNSTLGGIQRSISIRQIQKDLKEGIEEQFGKRILRTAGYGGRRVVRYEDQSQPIFSKQLTDDEAEILHESLKVLGQFDGLDNLQWLETLRKKLNETISDDSAPIISFSRNDRLKVVEGMLGRLYTAISRQQTIRLVYQPFGKDRQIRDIYPYQLKQYNNRWYLLGTPVGNPAYSYNPERIDNLALDRILDMTVLDREEYPYVVSPLNLKERFDEVVGVTFYDDADVEEIIIAVKPSAVSFIETKPIHNFQYRYPDEDQGTFKKKYPAFDDCVFYSIECRINYELISTLFSFQEQLVVVEATGYVPGPILAMSGMDASEQVSLVEYLMRKAKMLSEMYINTRRR